MNLQNILVEIDAEIARLVGAKELLTDAPAKRGPGRPAANASSPTNKRKRRRMSAEGRARIAAAQKARWAKARRASTKKPEAGK